MRTEEEIKKDLDKVLSEEIPTDKEKLYTWNERYNGLLKEWKTVQEAKLQEENNKRENVEKRQNEKMSKQIENLKNSGIGERYMQVDINSYICKTSDQEKNIKTVKEFITNPLHKNLWLIGVAGTGKTLLGAIICRYLGAKYIKSYTLKDEIDFSRSFSAKKNPTEVINDYANINVIVIDEIGRYKSPQEQEYLFRLLNERYEMKKATVLISNMTKKEFAEYLGNPIVDRFRDSCKCLEFSGDSYRAKERIEWNGEIDNNIFN